MKAREIIVRTLSRSWPFASGSGRIVDRLGLKLDLGGGERVVRTSDDFDISVLADDHIGKHIILSGKFDRSIVSILLDFCEPGDICADIGANIGYVASILLQRVPGSYVLCVEPQPGIVDLLQTNLSRFPQDRWDIVNSALSDVGGSGFLALDATNRGASKLVNVGGAKTVDVPLIHAGQFLGGLDRLDIIKMDIEGHEESVFRASLEALQRLHPRAILFEDQTGEAWQGGKIGRTLELADYEIRGIRKLLTATRLERVTPENAGQFDNFIAVSRIRTLPQRARYRHAL